MGRGIIAAWLAFLIAATAAAAPAGAKGSLDMDSCVAAALAGGEDFLILEKNLAAARASHAATTAKAGISLAASGGYGLAYGLGDSTYAKKAGASDGLGLGQSATGSLTMSMGTQSSTSPFTRLSLSASHAIPPAGAAATSSLGLSLAQTLWDGYPGGQTKAAVAKSLLALGSKELSAASSRSAAIAKVKQAYVTMLSAQRTVALRLASLDKQKALRAQMEAIYELKQASSVDLASARINERTAELDLRSAEKDLATARRRLASLMGLGGDADFSVVEVEEPKMPAESVEAALAIAYERRADAAQLENSRKSSQIDLELAKALSSPSVSLSGGFSVSLGWGDAPKSGDAASLSVKLGLPVADAGATKAQTEAAAAQAEIYAAQAAQLRRTIEADLRDAYEAALIQAERASLAKGSMELAESQLEVVRTQHQYGTATNQDLVNASAAAASAEAAWAAARGAWLGAVIQLETAMGL